MVQRDMLYLYATVFAYAPHRCIELGTNKGGSAWLTAHALRALGPGRNVVTIDIQDQRDMALWAESEPEAVFIRGDSASSAGEAYRRMGRPFEFALVDADHGRNGVLRDLSALTAVLRPGAIVMLHDSHNTNIKAAIREALGSMPYQDTTLRTTTLDPGFEPSGQVDAYGGLATLVYRP